jgi:hypothetical protein
LFKNHNIGPKAELRVEDKTEYGFSLVMGSSKLVVSASPLRLDFYSDGVLAVSANARGLLRFEQFRLLSQDDRVMICKIFKAINFLTI